MGVWPKVSGDRRAYLAYILGEAECSDALPLFKEGLKADDVQLVRMSVLALGRIGNADLLSELVACLQHDDAEIQNAATQSLITLGRQFPEATFAALQPLLSHAESVRRMLAVVVLRELDDPGVLDALSLAIKDSAAEVRRAAIKVFERFDVSDHVSSLLLALTDEDAEVRRTVVEILGHCTDESALDGLQLALKDEDLWVRSSAVRGLGRIAGEQNQPLIEQALKDPVGLVSIAALETVSEIAGAKAIPLMVTALDHADEEVVTAAMNLLTSYGSADWIHEHAERLINHPFWVVRAQIARSAVEMQGAAAGNLLKERLEVETEEVVRQQLSDLLADLTSE
jgi:HEAT repeat protein